MRCSCIKINRGRHIHAFSIEAQWQENTKSNRLRRGHVDVIPHIPHVQFAKFIPFVASLPILRIRRRNLLHFV